MVHWPTISIVTVEPETVHTWVVSEAKLTVRFELAVALSMNAGAP